MATRSADPLAALGDVFSRAADRMTESTRRQSARDDEARLHQRSREERATDLADVRTYSEGLTKDQRAYENTIFERNRLAHFHDLLRAEGFNPADFDKPELVQAFLAKRGPEYTRQIMELAGLRAQAQALSVNLPGNKEMAADLARVTTMNDVSQLDQARQFVSAAQVEVNKVLGTKEGEKVEDQKAAATAVAKAETKMELADRQLTAAGKEYDDAVNGNLTKKQIEQAENAAAGKLPDLAAKRKTAKGLKSSEKVTWDAAVDEAKKEVLMVAVFQKKQGFDLARRNSEQAGRELDRAVDNANRPGGQRFVGEAKAKLPPAFDPNAPAGAAPTSPPTEADKRAAAAKLGGKTPGALEAEAPPPRQYKYPGGILGLAERLDAKDPTVMRVADTVRDVALAPVTAAPVGLYNAVNMAARLGQAGLTGVIPDKSPLATFGEWVGGKIAGDPYAQPRVKPTLFAKPADVPVALGPTPVAPVRTDAAIVSPTPFAALGTQEEREIELQILTNFPNSPAAALIREKLGRSPLGNAPAFGP